MSAMRWGLSLLLLCGCAEAQSGLLEGAGPSGGLSDGGGASPVDAGAAPSDGGPGPDLGPRVDLGPPDGGAGPSDCELGEEPAPRVLDIPDACPFDPELQTEQLAYTPSRWFLAEELVRAQADTMLAPRELYLQARGEVCRILEEAPELQAFEAEATQKDLEVDLILQVADSETRQAMVEGRYEPWRCLNATIDAKVESFPMPGTLSVQVHWAGRYDRQRILERYAAMPGVSRVVQPFDLGASIRLGCRFERDGRPHYLFSESDARFPAPIQLRRWLFRVEADRIELLGTWEGSDPEELPRALDPEEC